ncbi:DsbA family protein [Lichenihabitans psoromatis]|uniref:DsbA family protein n=1 Tax=Lichenihabitans psoromatis TaxID=2528642 RepID=UPI001038505E|nr:DsbA family protein [Lichenihabitans psoromatis]
MSSLRRSAAAALSVGLFCLGPLCLPTHAETAPPASVSAATDPDLTRAALTDDPQTPTAGNPKGDVTIVAFFDYNCTFCMKAEPALEQLMAADPGLRLVYKDWPIFGKVSVEASRLALAAQYQGKYLAVHQALLGTHHRKVSAEQVRDIAIKAGADPARLDADLKQHGAEIDALLARTEKQATKMDFPGTPIFLIGPLLVNQALDLKGFQDAVATARKRQQGTP